MNRIYYYCIADFCFSVSGISGLDYLLPSFAAFRTSFCCEEERLFAVHVLPRLPEPANDMAEMDVSNNDLGQVRLQGSLDSYRI